MCGFCVDKLEPTYSNPSRAFKVNEKFKEWFISPASPVCSYGQERIQAKVSWLLVYPLYPLQHSDYSILVESQLFYFNSEQNIGLAHWVDLLLRGK